MKKSERSGNLINTGFVLISFFLAAGIAFSADPSAKRVKETAQETTRKTDPGEWKKVIEVAKKEGKIVIAGSPGEEWRKSMADMFQQEYPEIKVEFSAVPPRNLWPRIRQEREIGKKLWDLYSGGSNTAMDPKKDGLLAPIRPLLLPEIADDSKWIGGIDSSFNDKEKKYMFGYLLFIEPSAYVNRDFIKESDLKSTAQLLDPKFRGKIVMLTPTGGSTRNAIGQLAFVYGENFIRELLSKQDVIITDDNRQQVEWVVRGRYPISVGFSRTLLIPYEKQGLGKNVVGLKSQMEKITAASGTLCLFEGAPHPNAARVYINWLLSQKTQIMLSKNIQHNSRRTDVPPVEPAVDPANLDNYRNVSLEGSNEFDESLVSVIKEALKK